MGYKVYIFAFLLGAVILGSIPVEKGIDRDSVDQQGVFHLEVDNGFGLEAMISSHARTPLKQCFSSLHAESLKPFFLLRGSFKEDVESNFQSPTIQTFLVSILIHAP